MATHYINIAGGNDANSGASWAQAKQSLGAVSPSPGDVIKFAKSSDPVSLGTAQWTFNSRAVVFSSAPSCVAGDLIGKSGGEPWFVVTSVVGNTVTIAGVDNPTFGALGYPGVTESTATYKRPCISSTITHSMSANGSPGSPIRITGGWNTSTDLQDGETWIDGRNAPNNPALSITRSSVTPAYIDIDGIAVYGHVTGIDIGALEHFSLATPGCVGSTFIGIRVVQSKYGSVTIDTLSNNAQVTEIGGNYDLNVLVKKSWLNGGGYKAHHNYGSGLYNEEHYDANRIEIQSVRMCQGFGVYQESLSAGQLIIGEVMYAGNDPTEFDIENPAVTLVGDRWVKVYLGKVYPVAHTGFLAAGVLYNLELHVSDCLGLAEHGSDINLISPQTLSVYEYPNAVIYPVTTPTQVTSQSIGGMRKSGCSVVVTCPTATVGAVDTTYPRGWSCQLTNLSPGSNVVTLTVTDGATQYTDVKTIINDANANAAGASFAHSFAAAFAGSYVGPASYSGDLTAAHSFAAAFSGTYVAPGVFTGDLSAAHAFASVFDATYAAQIINVIPRNPRVGLSFVAGPWSLGRRFRAAVHAILRAIAATADVARTHEAASLKKTSVAARADKVAPTVTSKRVEPSADLTIPSEDEE